MTNTENLTIRIEPEIKKQASALFKDLGMDISTATRLFYRQAIRCGGLPFDVKLISSPKDDDEADNVDRENG